MIDLLGVGRLILATAFVVALTLQMGWKQVRVLEIPLGSGEGDTKWDVGEDEPVDEEVAGGELEDVVPTSVDVIDKQNGPNAEDLVLVTRIPTNSPIALQVAPMKNEGEKAVIVAKNPLEGPVIDFDNATETGEKDKPALMQVLPVTLSSAAESAVAELPTQNTESPTIMVDTTKPSLRTEEPAVISDTLTNDGARTQATEYMNQGNNLLVFVALAGICCIFLFVWGRKRRLSATSSSGTSEGISPKGIKVQYSQVPDEQPLSHSQDDDDEYCDDYEEDTFTNDRDDWDDWEGDSTQTHLNPFAAAPSAPRPKTVHQSNRTTYKLTQPLPPPPQHHVQLQESDVVAVKGDVLLSSVESSSSSDSFEVVTDEVHAPPTSSHSAAVDAEKESETADDLFSQFGMVPTFKKSAVVPPSPAATSAAPVSPPAATSVPSFPTAAEASALFAAEMDDELTAVDAADEWGEDDEWVKGI